MRRLGEVLVVLALLVLALPLALVIAIAIYWEDGGPVLFCQERAGQHGQPFTLVKFRSMQLGPHHPHRPHAHTTSVGRVLRRYGLDELPQLWQILRGDMSLIGPRPILVAETHLYTTRQAQRLQVRPGLTGWAQVQGRNTLAWRERVALDVWYVRHRTWWLDLYIFALTPWVLVRGKGVYGPGNQDPGVQEAYS